MLRLEWLNVEQAIVIFIIGLAMMLSLRMQKGSLVKYIPEHLHPHVLAGEIKVDRLYFTAMVLAWLEICIAIANPVLLKRGERTSVQQGQIMLVLDVSPSMRQGIPSKLNLAQYEIRGLLDEVDGEHVGLVAVTRRANLLTPPTFDTQVVAHMLPFAARSLEHKPGTAIEEGLLHALDGFQLKRMDNGVAGKKMMILISDGDAHSIDATALLRIEKALEDIQEAGMVVHVLDVGLGSEVLKMIALETEGTYLLSDGSASQLQQFYQRELRNQFIVDLGQVNYGLNQSIGWLFILMSTLFFWIGVMRVSKKVTRIILIAVGVVFATMLSGPLMANEHLNAGYEDYLEEQYLFSARHYRQVLGAVGRYGEAASHYQMFDFEHAQKQFVLAWILAKETDKTLARNALFGLGNSFYKQNDFGAAIAVFRAILTEDPQDKGAKHNLNLSLNRQQDMQRMESHQTGREREAESMDEDNQKISGIGAQMGRTVINSLEMLQGGGALENGARERRARPSPLRFVGEATRLSGEKKAEYIESRLEWLLREQAHHQLPKFKERKELRE